MRELENEVRATRKAPAEVLSVYSTLAKFKTLPKLEMKKRCVGTVRRIRKETKIFRSRLGGLLMKKGYKEGGGSL